MGVGVICARPGGTPLNSVDLFIMAPEVVNTVIVVHVPHLERPIVWTGSEELATGVPLDGIHLILKGNVET